MNQQDHDDPLSEWYADFFTELPNTFWRAAVSAETTAAEIDFLLRETGLAAGARVLDVPCGSGRHALELARRGHRVIGLDISPEAIHHARTAAAAERLEVDLRVADMAALPGGAGVVRADAAICMGNAFGYLEHAGTVGLLAALAGLLPPGGPLLLDYGFVAESLLPRLELAEPPMRLGGVEAVSVNSYDPERSRLLTAFTFRREPGGGRVEEHRGTSVQHVYTAAEVIRLLEVAGFGGIRLYGDPSGTPYRLGSPRLLLLARRG